MPSLTYTIRGRESFKGETIPWSEKRLLRDSLRYWNDNWRMLYAQLVTAMRKTESKNVENKIDTIKAKSTILDNRDDQLEVMSKQIVYLMSAIEEKKFKPNNRGGKFFKLMKQYGQVYKNGQKKGRYDLSKVQCYRCKEYSHHWRECMEGSSNVDHRKRCSPAFLRCQPIRRTTTKAIRRNQSSSGSRESQPRPTD